MDYNSQRKKLILPEYGRNIQIMIDHLATIEDRDERTRAARTIISVMGNLYPHLRDVPDFRHKLWDHLMIMSNFTLDIDSPYPLPDKAILEEKPERLPYSKHRIKYKHYGLLTEKLIEKIKEQIYCDINTLYGGNIEMPEGMTLSHSKDLLQKTNKKPSNNNNNNRQQKNRKFNYKKH